MTHSLFQHTCSCSPWRCGATSSAQPHSWILQTPKIRQPAWSHHCPWRGTALPVGNGECCSSARLGHVVLPTAPVPLCSRRSRWIHGGGTAVQGTRLILQIPRYHSSVPVLQTGIMYFEVVVLEYHPLGHCILHIAFYIDVISHMTPDYVLVRDEKADVSPPYGVKPHSEAC